MKATIRNWGEFQHYKDRSPPWIKFHRSLLDNYDFHRLPVASRALAPMLWLLAAESNDGSVCVDPDFIAFRLRMTEAQVIEALNPLISANFIVLEQDASDALAERKQSACLEREVEGEVETENNPSDCLSAAADCPHAEIVALYHELLPANPRIKVWNGSRAANLRARWREDAKRQSLDYWRRFFAHVAASAFLTGQVADRNGRAFLPGLDWLVLPNNFAKVIEGKYHERV